MLTPAMRMAAYFVWFVMSPNSPSVTLEDSSRREIQFDAKGVRVFPGPCAHGKRRIGRVAHGIERCAIQNAAGRLADVRFLQFAGARQRKDDSHCAARLLQPCIL